jgi:hypothetical protein
MNAAVNDIGATLTRKPADLQTAVSVRRVNAYANDIARSDVFGAKALQSFVHYVGIAIFSGCGGGQDVKPSWGDYTGAEGDVAGVNQVNSHVHSSRVLPAARQTRGNAYNESLKENERFRSISL